ncbi:MAG: 30S ribosomal protein S8 [Acidobacteria bacterium]|jgi:small subunit ribosomal protein S8|nr:MAG: 30S ribosomal protein S8 [Acidobacteriota bacterium]
MNMTDSVADLLTRMRNALGAKHESLDVPSSKLKLQIVRILKEEGYVADYSASSDARQGTIHIRLRYGPGKRPVISSLARVSRPGCRVYARKDAIPPVLGGMGVCIVSTSQGLFTGKQAQEKGLGGEILCAVS